jgi:hypothetical protein
MGISQGLLDIIDVGKSSNVRFWNRAGKETALEVLKYHHKFNIPKHFRVSAKRIYGYKKRQSYYKDGQLRGYVAEKKRRFGSSVDLVKTGRLKKSVVGRYREGRFTGNYMAGTMTGSIVMQIPWPAVDDPTHSPTSVKLQDMKNEIRVITQSEGADLARIWEIEFVKRLRNQLATKKQKAKQRRKK